MDDDEREPWERESSETRRAYESFRAFRDLGPGRSLRALTETPIGRRVPAHVERWCARWQWRRRADAWDDEHDRLDDAARLEAIRQMHRSHQLAGRVALSKALAVLQHLQPADIPAGAAVRLLDIGSRLERQMLSVSVAELQGQTSPVEHVDDPWDVIARELQGAGVFTQH